MKILVSGATGFIGTPLVIFLRHLGHEVSRLSRRKSTEDVIYWNPVTEEIHLDQFENFDAVIHLAGENVGSKRWTKERKQAIFLSRCRDTWLLSEALSRLHRPPSFFFCASAVGFYGDRGDEILTETSPPGSGFLADVCVKWEAATQAVKSRGVRVVHGRFGAVLSPEGGMLGKMLPAFRLSAGGKFGSGKQYLSWITLEDLIRAIDFLLHREDLSGIFNFCTPNPVTNAEFTRLLAEHLHRKAFFSLPSPLLKVLFGQMAKELFLASTRMVPKRLLENGFLFSSPTLVEAFKHLL